MARLNGKCIGDCSRCELLANGEVDMIPCVLDQIFARVRKQGAELDELKKMVSERNATRAPQFVCHEEVETAMSGVADAPEEEMEV